MFACTFVSYHMPHDFLLHFQNFRVARQESQELFGHTVSLVPLSVCDQSENHGLYLPAKGCELFGYLGL